jgi:hypothetical protein
MSRRRRVGALALDDLDDWLAAQPDIAGPISNFVREVIWME